MCESLVHRGVVVTRLSFSPYTQPFVPRPRPAVAGVSHVRYPLLFLRGCSCFRCLFLLVLPLALLLLLSLLLLLLSRLLLVLLLNVVALLPLRCRCLPPSNTVFGQINITNKNEHSFCGKNLPKIKTTNCDMVYEEGSDVESGGRWAVSVYNLGVTDADTNGITGGDADADGDEDQYAMGDENPVGEDAGAGGGEETDVSKEKSPVVTGKRAFTVVNECSQTIKIGSTGGR